ncbi:MAG: IS1595 family transposase [Acidobacteriota bacterium]
MPKTLQEAILYFADEDRCIRYLADRRWPDGVVVCPTCGRKDAVYLPKRRVWQCKSRHPKCQFSIKVGTIFEDSPLPLGKWLAAMWLIANCKNGISSWEIHRALKITQKSAWFVLHRVRLAMKDERKHKFGFGGPVESDETFIGPNPAKMNRRQREKYNQRRGLDNRGGNIGGAKAIVHGMLDRELRQVRANVIPNVKREALQNAILENVTPFAKVYTDEWLGYQGLGKSYVHKVINHSQEYVKGKVHTQGIENYWSLLKRTLRGTYVAVEPFHLDRYLDEQAFRYNNRATKDNPLNDGDRFTLAVTQILGRRITYRELTGKTGDARQF